MAFSVLINGAKGRMGQTLLTTAKEMNLAVGAATDVGDDMAAAAGRCDVIVDFSSHAATKSLLELAVAQKKAVVIGTTGHSADEKARCKERTISRSRRMLELKHTKLKC